MTGIPMHWAVVTIGVTTIVYTYFGGMRAVLWTDFLQFTVYMIGAIIAFSLLLNRLPGGWEQLVAMGEKAGKLRIFDLTWDWSEPYGLWAGLIGGLFITLGSWAGLSSADCDSERSAASSRSSALSSSSR